LQKRDATMALLGLSIAKAIVEPDHGTIDGAARLAGSS
jgi:hypothetical protein